MTEKIERQYRYSQEDCQRLKISSILIGRTMEEASAISIRALYETVRTKGNVWASTATDEELKTEIINTLKQRPDLINVIQETLSSFLTI